MSSRRPRGRRRGWTPPAEPIELDLHGFTHGGEAVGRRPDGKVCFVPHALPGERVLVQVTDERKSWSRGELLELLESSPDRVEPPCPYAHPGACGGCALQHVRPERQAELLRGVVIDQLERIGHVADPPVAPTRRPHTGDGLGYRNRARFSADDEGRLGFHRQGSDAVIPIDWCRLLTEGAHGARTEAGDAWPGAESVTVRAGDNGAGMIEAVPGEGVLPDLPEGRRALVLVDALGHAHALRGEPVVRYQVNGADFQVSATSFFQPSSAAAHMLVEEVLNGAKIESGTRVLDLFSGAGLFSYFLAQAGGVVTAYESHPTAVTDALRNVGDQEVEVVQGDAERGVADLVARGVRTDVVVLDPPRKGAGRDLCENLARLGPQRIVYVACDPAALARDAGALTAAGYQLVRVVPIDQFTHTGHIEAVATFLRQ